MRRDRGFALLIVLWSVALLALLATGITAAGRTDVQLAANLRGAAVAEAAADGAVFEAVFHLLDPARPWPADGAPREVSVPGARIVLRIVDEAGKINPNNASPELLQALLRRVGADAQTSERAAAAIIDWRFPGEAPRLNGAKAPQYRAAGRDYGPPGASFQSLDELGAVLGMTPELLARLMPHLSILTDAEPDPQRADEVVRQALRDVLGPPRAASGAPAPPRTVTVTADAETGGGSRFTRRAALRLGATEKEPMVRVLAWD